jgi:glycosyltransferase involved in cell wall biosynthesis
MMSYQNIKFSVILPNYNNGATLARAIDSVLAQTWPAHEIIVIDDGSSDDSREIAARYGSRIIYVYQQNAGVSAARNLGAHRATGTWLAFLDADDIFFPNRLEAHAEWIAREPGIDFLLADQEFRDPDDKLLQHAISGCAAGRELVARHPGQVDIPLMADDFEMLVGDGFAEIRTLSLPRTTFLALGGFPLNRKIGEDLYFFVRLLRDSTRGGVVNLPLAVYYIYPLSALRKEPVAAQRAFVAMLDALKSEMGTAPAGIRRGVRAKLRQARLSLAYMYLRDGQRRAALAAVAPMLLRAPSVIALRDVASVLRGLP